MDKKQLAIEKHKEWRGKIEIISRAPVTNREELSIAYTPGVAEPCLLIAEDEDKAYAGPGRYRAFRRDAGDGGKMCIV